MDPNECLAQMRRAYAEALEALARADNYGTDLQRHVDRGGFAPDDAAWPTYVSVVREAYAAVS